VNDMMDFAEVWCLFDPKAHGRIPEELFDIPEGSEPVRYPGGEETHSLGFLQELSRRVPILGCDPTFEAERAAKVKPHAAPAPTAVDLGSQGVKGRLQLAIGSAPAAAATTG
jgi:hypothetical protein